MFVCRNATSSTNESYEELLAQGKRNLMCKDIPQALNQLQQASRLVYVNIFFR